MLCVLSACISPEGVKQLELRDSEERLKQYMRALVFYIKSERIEKIVFCDNSNFECSYDKVKKLAKKYGKQLEILRYKEDVSLVSKKGKGYGEGRILEYVLKNSKLLREETYFYKITGRLIVKNIDTIVKKESTQYNYFNKNMYCYATVDTRFFGVNKEMYQKYMMHAYQRVNDSRGRYLEHCFLETLENKKIPYRNHIPFPVIEGISGTVGKKYGGRGFFISSVNTVLSWAGLYNCDVIYHWLYKIFQKSGKGFEDTGLRRKRYGKSV